MRTLKNLVCKRAFGLFKANKAISERAYDVFTIFKESFGEDHIDITEAEPKFIDVYNRYTTPSMSFVMSQYKEANKHSIVIKVDKETVRNEYGTSTVIYDLFVKFYISTTGKLGYGIYYKRSSFTKNQLYSKYIHSHCPSLNLNAIDEWKNVCTGTGPINHTIQVLNTYNAPLELWYAFIAELRQIIRVESLTGGPYTRIERITGPYTKLNTLEKYEGTPFTKNYKNLLASYIKSDRLRVGLINGRFCLGCTFVEWLVDFTQYAIAWGEKNHQYIPLQDTLIMDNCICIPNTTRSEEANINEVIGKPVITFKGTEYKLKVIDNGTSTEQKKLISPQQGATIIKTILDVLNYRYGKTTIKREEGTTDIIFA